MLVRVTDSFTNASILCGLFTENKKKFCMQFIRDTLHGYNSFSGNLSPFWQRFANLYVFIFYVNKLNDVVKLSIHN